MPTTVLWFALVSLTAWATPGAWATPADRSLSPSDCYSNQPLAEVHSAAITLRPNAPTSTPIGSIYLPFSASQPGVLTWARVQIFGDLAGESSAKFTLVFDFEDPLPLGIPFTFQGAELEVAMEYEKPVLLQIDWSNACAGPGWSYFPRQKRTFEFTVPRTHSRIEDLWLRFVHLRLWGGRF
jgi:hypothetical protein